MSSHLSIRHINPSITTFARPFARSKLTEIGARMSVVRLASGGLWVFAPTPLDETTKAEFNKLGNNVEYVVCPNVEHHIHAGDYKAQWPNAKLIGVEGLPKKRPDLNFFRVLSRRGNVENVGYENEFEHVYFSGQRNKDVAFLHRPSKTLFEADLLFNLPPNEQYPPTTNWSFPQKLVNKMFAVGSTSQKYFIRCMMTTDKKRMKEDARSVANWDFQRIVPCHGDVIEEFGNRAWRELYDWVLK